MKDLVDTKSLKLVSVTPLKFAIKKFFKEEVSTFSTDNIFLTLESIYKYSKKYDAIITSIDENSLKLVKKSLSIDVSFIFLVGKKDKERMKDFIGFKRVSFLFLPFDEMQATCMLYGLAKATLLKNQLNFLEKNLKESQHISKLGSWEYDVESDTFWLSEEVYEILPITKDMRLSDPVSMLSFLPKKQRLYVTYSLKEAIRTKDKFSIEFHFPEDGKEHFFKAKGEVIEKSGEIKRVIGTFQNIDESKRIEKILKKQKAVASEIIDSQSNMIILTDGEKILGANQSFYDFFNCHSVEEFPKKYGDFAETFIEKESYLSPRVKNWLDVVIENRNLKSDSKVALENSITKEIRDFIVKINRFTGDKEYVVTFVDITEHLKLEEDLKKSEDELESEINEKTWDLIELNNKLIEQTEMFDEAEHLAKIGSWYYDLHSQLLYWSKQMYVIYERTSQEGTAAYDEILSSTEIKEKDFFKELFQKAIDSGDKELRIEHTITFNDKEKILVTNLVVERDSGKPYKVFGYTQDVTEQKLSEKKQRESEKLLIQQTKMAELGGMIGAIAHQWKQPLNSLALTFHELVDSYEYGELDEEHLKTTVKRGMNNIKFMSQTIEDFRNFFKPSKKKIDFLPTKAIETVISILNTQLSKSLISLEFEKNDETLSVYGFENEFKQVILNLLNNSKDAFEGQLREHKRIKVSVTEKDNFIWITLEDNAGGIPEDIIPKIFNEYFSTKGDEGTGIGLYMSKNIIENSMGGTLEVENSEEGAEFTIKLPKV